MSFKNEWIAIVAIIIGIIWYIKSRKKPEEEPEIIKPKFNRLLIFDAGCLHGVSQIKSGRRRAVAINLWDQKPTTFTKDY